MRAIILKAASHHIPSGQHRFNKEPVPTEILENMRAREDRRSRDSTSHALQEMNDEITRITNEHKRQKWRQYVETLDHKTDLPKLWRTIKAIDGKPTPKAENEAITFDVSSILPKADRQLFQPTVHHFKAGQSQTHFFPGDPVSI